MKRRKILSILLAFILSISLTMPTFAAEIPQAENELVDENDEEQIEESLEEPEENKLTEESSVTVTSDKRDASVKSIEARELVDGDGENNEPREDSETVISKVEDFVIEGTVVKGFSESGLNKLEAIKDVVIPEKNAGGEAITEIAASAFKEKEIVSVVFPNTLETIGATAFQKNKLKEIILPDSVTNVGVAAFSENHTLEKVKISNSMTTIPQNFVACTIELEDGTSWAKNFSEVVIPNNITEIGRMAFSGHSFTTVEIPGSVKIIEQRAFAQAITHKTLENLILHEGLEKIGKSAFFYTAIKEVNFPLTVNSLENDSFQGCSEKVKVCVGDKEQLEKLKTQTSTSKYHELVYRNLIGTGWSYDDFIYDGAKVTGWSEKGNKTKVSNKKLVVPNINPETGDTITEIGNAAFKGASTESMMTSISFPEAISVIGEEAFAGNNLSEVTIPAAVTSFANNSGLVTLQISNKEFLKQLKEEDLDNVKLITHISACDISVEEVVYTGEMLTPKVTIKDGEISLVEGVDYIIDSYGNNKDAGTAKVSIRGSGNYAGSTIKYFTIGKAKRDIIVKLLSNTLQVGDVITFTVEGEEDRKIKATTNPTKIVSVNATKRTITADKIGTTEVTITAQESVNYQQSDVVISVTVKGNMEGEDNKWSYADFIYNKNTVTGWSESGNQKRMTIKELIVPDTNLEANTTVTIIGENAFAASEGATDGITNVEIPGTIKTIGKRAFAGNKLTEVKVPQSVTKIELDAFSDNEEKVRLVFGGKEQKDKFLNIGLENVSMLLDISGCEIDITDRVYTGSVLTPEIVVKDGETILKEGTDYIVEFPDENINAGTTKFVIKGIGDNYAGSVDRYFTITKADITASISPGSIKVGEKAQITAVCGEGAVSYESKNKDIASVDEKGVVTGIAAGKAEITVTSEGNNNYKAGSCNVALTVTKPDDENDNNNNNDNDNNNNNDNTNNNITETKPDIKVNKIAISGITKKVAAGKKIKLTAKVFPQNATNKTVKWISENPKIAKVNNAGVVTVMKKTGGKKVTIKTVAADGSGIKASYKLTIMKDSVKSIKLKAKKTVKAGKSLKVKATVKTTGKKVNKKLKWTSSNVKYATVSSKGVVKAKKAGKGKIVKITASSTDGSNKKKVIKIKIK